MVQPRELAEYCRERRIPPKHRFLFHHLLGEADWKTGAVEGFSLTRCAGEIGFGPSGRRTLKTWLDQLIELGVVAYQPAVGRSPGRVLIADYRRLVRCNQKEQARDQTDVERAPNADGGQANRAPQRAPNLSQPARPTARPTVTQPRGGARGQTSIPLVPPGVLLSEDVLLVDNCLTRDQGRQAVEVQQPPTLNGTTDVDGAIAPLVEYARRCGLPHHLDDDGRAHLATRSHAELVAGVANVARQLRAGKHISSPIGLLVRKAKDGDADFFAVSAPPAPAPAASPTDEEPEAVADKAAALAELRSLRMGRRVVAPA